MPLSQAFDQTFAASRLEAMEQEESTRLTRLTENLPGSLYQYQVNPDGSYFFPFATRGISEVYEYSVKEILADAEKVFGRVHPDDLDKLKDSIQKSALSMQDWDIEYRVRLPSKGLCWLRGQAKPQRLDSGAILWHGYLSDITQEKKQADDLKRYQSQYRIAMEATQIGVWSWDIVTNEVTWSDEAYTLLGYKPQQFLVTLEHIHEKIMHPEDLKNFELSIFNNLENNERFQIHFRLKSANGEWLWIESRGRTTQFNEQGKPIYMMGTHTDITNIKNTEDALMEARQVSERAMQAKSDLLSTVSHEIRTPLSGIIGLSELSLEENDSERLKKTLRKIHHSSEQLLQILNDTLDYSKMEAGQLQRHNSPFNIKETIQDIINLFKPNALSKNLILESQIDSMPQLIENDELRLRQVLSNLLSNAIKFTPQGKVTIRVRIQQFSDSNIQLEFSVTDTGIGIAPQVQKQLFSAYSQADTHTAHHYGGTGLGLMISERLVKLLGGESIKLVSTLGKGSCFSFTLPFKQVDVCELLLPSNTNKPQCSKVMQGHLLVADDVATNREITQHLLISLGFKVTMVENGQQALDVALSEIFDLVFMDLNMPVMDGFTATKKIKQHKPQLPIIALTASAIEPIQAKLTAAGLDGCLTKPLKKQELCKKLSQWLPAANTISSTCEQNNQALIAEDSIKTEALNSEQLNVNLVVNNATVHSEAFDFNHGLTLFTGNEGIYIRLLHDFALELNTRYRLLGQRITALILQPKPLQADDWIKLHPETHTLKGTSANLGLKGVSNAATQIDDLLREGLQPTTHLLNSYQGALKQASSAIKIFTETYNQPAVLLPESTDTTLALTDNTAALSDLLNAIKANEFINELDLKQVAQQIPSRLASEWQGVADAIDQLDFTQAEQQLTALIAQIT